MTRADALVVATNFIVGWIAASLFVGSALAINSLLVALILAVILWILRVAARADVIYAGIGLAIGVVLTVLLGQIALNGDPTLLALALLLFVFKA